MPSESLELWLRKATVYLSTASAAQVRAEIQEHYESAREDALASGATEDGADRSAVASLGNAWTANRQYRKVLLTAEEARHLRQIRWEGRAICGRRWLRWLVLIPALGMSAGLTLLAFGGTSRAGLWVLGMAGTALLFAAPLLRINTPARGRVFRCARWVWQLAVFAWAHGPDVHQWYWNVSLCMLLLAWIEWTQMSLRRKLPVSEWPKQLYF